MAEVIKKISAFGKIGADEISGNEEFIIAKDNKNYKISLDQVSSKIDENISTPTSNIAKYIRANYATIDNVNSVIASNVGSQKKVNESLLDKINEIETYVTENNVSIDNLGNVLEEYVKKSELGDKVNELFTAIAAKYATKEELTAASNEIMSNVNNAIDELKTTHDTIHEAKITEIEAAVAGITETLDGQPNFVTDGDSSMFLANDGNYYNTGIYTYEFNDTIALTNDMIKDNTINLDVKLPKFMPNSLLVITVHCGSSTMHPTYVKSIKTGTEFVDFEKRFATNTRVFRLSFDTSISQYMDGNKMNILKSSIYLNDDKVSDKLSISQTAIDILHEGVNMPIELKLSDSFNNDNAIAPHLTWQLFYKR